MIITYRTVLGINAGVFKIIVKPKSAGIFGKPIESASCLPTICSIITAASAPKSHPRTGILYKNIRILFLILFSGADNSLLVTSIMIPF